MKFTDSYDYGMYVKMLTPINGCDIEKSAYLNADGKNKSDTIVYSVYDQDDPDFPIDCFTTLKEAQRCAREYRG